MPWAHVVAGGELVVLACSVLLAGAQVPGEGAPGQTLSAADRAATPQAALTRRTRAGQPGARKTVAAVPQQCLLSRQATGSSVSGTARAHRAGPRQGPSPARGAPDPAPRSGAASPRSVTPGPARLDVPGPIAAGLGRGTSAGQGFPKAGSR